MKYRILGRTGLRVSEVGFGAWAIGGQSYGTTRDEESLEALETAWEHGVNFFDTADAYGEGHSEELIGKFIRGKRDRVVIATKLGWDFYHGGLKRNYNPDYMRFASGESLKRLGTDHLDIYQLHNPPPEAVEAGEIFRVMEEFKAQGKIRFYGVSVYTPREAKLAVESSGADTIQLILNLLDQRAINEFLPLAKEKRIGVIVREPLACGLLTGKYSAETRFPKNDHRNRWSPERKAGELEKFERLKSAIPLERISLVRAALEFVLQFEAVSTVIPGAKTKAQVLENVKASEEPVLSAAELSLVRNVYESEPLFQTGHYRV